MGRRRVDTRGVNDSGLESAPEYEFGSFLEILDGDSGSGSFLVWSRFQPGIGSRLVKSQIRNPESPSIISRKEPNSYSGADSRLESLTPLISV